MKYNLRNIMLKAWKTFRKGGCTFAVALHRAWLSAKAEPVNAERIARAAAAHGITETVNTFYAWKQAGYTVKHGSKALFSVELISNSKGDNGSYTASFFSESQVTAA